MIKQVVLFMAQLHDSVRAVAKEGGMQINAMYPLKIWMHVLGICKISKTNTLVTSELRDDNITGRSTREREGRERDRA